MSQDDLKQIIIGDALVGIINFNTVLQDLTEECADMSDDEIAQEMVKRLEKKNYIPDSCQEEYAAAFLREFKKFRGEPVDDASAGLTIAVLGPGCAQCDRLEKEVMAVLAELQLPAILDHVTDIKKFADYGVMSTPALVINGKVVSVGSVPSRIKIQRWLADAARETK